MILITVEFWENKNIIVGAASEPVCYEFDLVVNRNLTCDQLLGAIFGGLRNILTERCHIDLTKRIKRYVYDSFESDSPYSLRGKLTSTSLRDYIEKSYEQNMESLSDDYFYNRFFSEYQLPDGEKSDKIGWILCWEVFQQCYFSYFYGEQGVKEFEHSGLGRNRKTHPVIYRGTVFSPNNSQSPRYYHTTPLLLLEHPIHGSKTLTELGFTSNTRLIFDHYRQKDAPASLRWFFQSPKNQNSPHQELTQMRTEHFKLQDIAIDAPNSPVLPSNNSVLPIVLSPLVTTGSVIAVMVFAGKNLPAEVAGVFGATMVLSAGLVSFINYQFQQKEQRKKLETNYLAYEQYIKTTIKRIQKQQKQEIQVLRYLYPPAFSGENNDNICSRVLQCQTDHIFSRTRDTEGFLCIRVGHSSESSQLVRSSFSVLCPSIPTAFSSVMFQNIDEKTSDSFRLFVPQRGENISDNCGFLSELPASLVDEYTFLKNAPVYIDLYKNQFIGVLLKNPAASLQPFLMSAVTDLCFHHKPEALQIVWCMERKTDWEEKQNAIRAYRHLPHFRNLLNKSSQFVMNRTDANMVFDQLYELFFGNQASQAVPHTLLIIEEQYNLRNHPLYDALINKMSASSKAEGLSIMFCSRSEYRIPSECSLILDMSNSDTWNLIPAQYLGSSEGYECQKYALIPDVCTNSNVDRLRFRKVQECIEAYYESMVSHPIETSETDYLWLLNKTLLDRGKKGIVITDGESHDTNEEAMLALYKDYIVSEWKEKRYSHAYPHTVSVAIGQSYGEVITVDFSATKGNKHLLVIGSSEKKRSDFLRLTTLSLCANYPPEQLRFCMLLANNTGEYHLFQNIPHFSQLLTYEQGDTEPECNTRIRRIKMLEREVGFELQNRYRKLDENKFYDITQYNQKALKKQKEDLIPHMFIVFELYSDYIGEASTKEEIQIFTRLLKSIIENGNRLGVHAILLTDNSQTTFVDTLKDLFPTKITLNEKVDEPFTTDDSMSVLSQKECGKSQKFYLGCTDEINVTNNPDIQLVLIPESGEKQVFFDSNGYTPSMPVIDENVTGQEAMGKKSNAIIPFADAIFRENSFLPLKQIELLAKAITICSAEKS